jgi:hypothetical protein
VEKILQRFIRFHSPVKLFPVLESEENLWYFVARTGAAIAVRVNEQQAKDLMNGRHKAAFLRGLDKLLWNELWLIQKTHWCSARRRRLNRRRSL